LGGSGIAKIIVHKPKYTVVDTKIGSGMKYALIVEAKENITISKSLSFIFYLF
jgi:hypothetical protein